MLSIAWGGQKFDLYPERAVGWRSASTLIIADPHFGKAATFRHHGIPVPEGGTQADLNRLSKLLDESGARRLIILGDLLHARAGRSASTMSILKRWCDKHAALEMILVRGNHDQCAGDPPSSWKIRCVDEPVVHGGFSFCHDPRACAQTRCRGFAGHVHPCATLHDIDGTSLRPPCFLFSDRQAILPAFGAFTGMHPVRPRRARSDRLFAIGPGEVIEVCNSRSTRPRADLIEL